MTAKGLFFFYREQYPVIYVYCCSLPDFRTDKNETWEVQDLYLQPNKIRIVWTTVAVRSYGNRTCNFICSP